MESLSERDEAQKIERTLRDAHARVGLGWKDAAVLYRTNAQSRSIEEALRRGGIPYRLVGGVSFYERKEVKDLLAYLRAALNPRDLVAFLRILNVPRRGLGDKVRERIEQAVAREGSGAEALSLSLDSAPKAVAPAPAKPAAPVAPTPPAKPKNPFDVAAATAGRGGGS